MPGLASYMAQYDHEHTSGWNKLLHGVGIPMIFAGIILLILTKWALGAVFFVGGWTLLLVGHRIEGNHPAFLQGPVYLLVGPVWVAKEIWDFVNRGHRARLANPGSDSVSDTTSAAAQTKRT